MKCKVDGCERKSRKLNLCTMHYSRFKRNGDPLKLKNEQIKFCTYPGCNNPFFAKGFCQNHYAINRRKGTPDKNIYPKICTISGCNKIVKSKGLCSKHERSEWRRKHPDLAKIHVEKAKQRKRQLKKEAVEYKGGKCSVCGYNKYQGALEFHHINPLEKDDIIASLINALQTLEQMKNELDKCILMCSNCHKEIHNELNESGSK